MLQPLFVFWSGQCKTFPCPHSLLPTAQTDHLQAECILMGILTPPSGNTARPLTQWAWWELLATPTPRTLWFTSASTKIASISTACYYSEAWEATQETFRKSDSKNHPSKGSSIGLPSGSLKVPEVISSMTFWGKVSLFSHWFLLCLVNLFPPAHMSIHRHPHQPPCRTTYRVQPIYVIPE